MLYKNLINYYHLNEYIHINEKNHRVIFYVSSSPYETLGYSILETIAQGNKALVYYGDDNVLRISMHHMKRYVFNQRYD